MLNQYLRGGSAELDQLNRPAGELAIDLERKALRVYNGETQGGYEVLGGRDHIPNTGPGPQVLMAGDLTTGFYGEVSGEDFISYADLSTLVGLSAGTLHNQDQGWLKFSMDGTPAYVSKRSIRYYLSWNNINAQDLVFGQVVQIGGLQYTVRLMTGLVNPDTYEAGGEWNRLLCPVHVDDPNQEGWGIGYTNADLGFVGAGNGSINWTQETVPSNAANRVLRGYNAVLGLNSFPASSSAMFRGWRPILIPLV